MLTVTNQNIHVWSISAQNEVQEKKKKKSETKMGKREKEGSYGKAHGPRQYVTDEC